MRGVRRVGWDGCSLRSRRFLGRARTCLATALLSLVWSSACAGTVSTPYGANAWESAVPWIATASSSDSDSLTPDMAIDGDLTTRWSSAFEDAQWFRIDFGRAIELREIVLVWENAYTKSYDLLVSENGLDWKKVHGKESGEGGREAIKLADPVRARYMKLDLKKRATEWGNSLFEILVNPPAGPGRATASSGDDAYAAGKALDGDMTTRWSSNFADSQYWQAEFDEPRELCGLTIFWETAFGEIYTVEIAGRDGVFRRVYATSDGDGLRDIIYFKPALVTTMRINCVQRGTGWGFSFWEVVFHDGNNPPIATAAGRDPVAVLDGDTSTCWQGDGPGPTEILLQLPRRWDLGGLLLAWGDDYPRSYAVECSADGSKWTTVHATTEGNGGTDLLFFNPISARQIRIRCREGAGRGFSLAEIELKGSEEKATPIKVYQALAKDAPEGMYPLHLRRLQEFWTVSGVPDDEEESLLSENGAIEPYKNGFTVLPFLSDGEKLITFADCEVTQDLADGILPIPGVAWQSHSARLDIRAVSAGAPGKSWTAVRYRVTNTSPDARKIALSLAVLPVQLNPVWQHGGHSAINTIGFGEKNGVTAMSVNDRPRLYAAKSPARRGAAANREGSAVALLARGEMPSADFARDPDGLASAALAYDFQLEPGASDEVVLVYSMHDATVFPAGAKAPSFFEAILAERKKFWSDLLLRFTIEIPEPRLVDVMRSNIAYILINKDGPWIKPGPRNYNHSWVRDGAMTSVALLQMGLKNDVKKWLDAVLPHVAANGTALDGMVPYIFFEGGHPVGFNVDDGSGEGKEYDSQGEFVFAIRRYFDMTGDRKFLATVYPKMAWAMKFQAGLRRMRMTPEFMNDPAKRAFRGILPPSNSHEGYYPAMHSHWDNFWGLRGLKDAIHLAEVLARKEDAAWMRKELEEFRAAVLESIRTTIEERKIDYIPGCVEKGDFDPTSTSIAIMVTGDVEHLPKEIVKRMYDKYYAEFAKGMEPGSERSFTPYEVRNAASFVRMGERDRALAMLRWLTRDSVRPFAWNHMAEMVYARKRAPSYIGDMPHTWVGSGYISALRTLIVYEQEEELFVAAGIPKEWYDKGVTIRGLPTLFGSLGYTIKPVAAGYEIELSAGVHPSRGVVIPLPAELRGHDVKVDGRPVSAPDGLLRVARTPARITIAR